MRSEMVGSMSSAMMTPETRTAIAPQRRPWRTTSTVTGMAQTSEATTPTTGR